MQQFIGTRWGRSCWERSRTDEHEISRKKIGLDTPMKEVTRRGSSMARITKSHWLIFEQFKDTLVELQLRLSWWSTFKFLTLGKSLCSTEFVPSTSTPSLRTDSLQEENKTRNDDRPSSSHLQPFRGRSRWRSTQWWLHNAQESARSQQLETWSRFRVLGKIVPSTRSRISILADEIECNHRTQSCAGELHLQGNFSKRTSNTVRKNLNPSTCAKGDTQVQLAITAAATLW